MLDGAAGKSGRRNADTGTHGVAKTLADRLADRLDDTMPRRALAADDGTSQELAAETPNDLKRAQRHRSANGEDETDDARSAAWLDMRVTDPATADRSQTPDAPTEAAIGAGGEDDQRADGNLRTQQRDNSSGVTAEGRRATGAGPASGSPPSASTAGTVTSSAGPETSPAEPGQRPPSAMDGQAAQPSVPRRGSAEIAAILDRERGAPHPTESPTNGQAAGFPDAAQPIDLGLDHGEVRVLSDPGLKTGGNGPATQQMPFASAVAMLNLMAEETSVTPVRPNTGTAPSSGKSTAMGSAAEASDKPASLLETASAEPSDGFASKSPVSGDAPSARSHSDRDAREGSPGSDRDSSQPTFVDKPVSKAIDAPMAVRLGTTAAGVVETLASVPMVKAASATPRLAVDAETVSSTTHTLTIQLRPVELGEITATLRMNGDAITVEMATEKMEAYDRLNVDSDAIVKALRGLGLQVDQVTIQPPQVAAASSRSDGGMQNQTSNGSNQQFAQTGNSSGGGSEGQRGTASQGEQRNGGQARQSASPVTENRPARGLVI
jgi:chemotaxis protein MotD